jgi:hypothetical protein
MKDMSTMRTRTYTAARLGECPSQCTGYETDLFGQLLLSDVNNVR